MEKTQYFVQDYAKLSLLLQVFVLKLVFNELFLSCKLGGNSVICLKCLQIIRAVFCLLICKVL